ncbi:MAG: hypothetical protein K0R90_1827 [Oscillospiraceae bacterium]|nr:hypothetical protein [Oscillospiraceae bacterium]
MFSSASSYFSILIPPWPEYAGSNYRHFSENEKHITRCFNEFVAIFMLENSLYFSEDDEDIVLTPGEWYVQLPGLKQQGKLPSPFCKYFYIHFKAAEIRLPYVDSSECLVSKIKKNGRLTLPVRGKFDKDEFVLMFDRLKTIGINRSNYISEQAVFLQILESLALTVNPPESKYASITLNLQEYLAKNYHKDIKLNNLNTIFSYSNDYLTKIFKEEYGITPSQYIKKLRIKNAKELLTHTEKTIGEISESIGYHDETVFFRAFKQQTGMSPGAFRTLHRFENSENKDNFYDHFIEQNDYKIK